MTAIEVTWLRSSFCANGACVDVRRVGDTIQVRDGKLGDDGIVQEWTFAEWNWLLVAIIEGDDHPAVDLDDADVWLGAPALLFDRNEWNEFVKGVKAGEFDVDELSGSAPSEGYGAGLAQVGPDFGTRSDQVVTGAGAIAVPPVPVTAPVSATAIRRALYDSLSPNFEIDSDGYDDAAVAVALLIEAVPVAAQPRYVLDAPAILDLAGRYAAACVEAATTGSPKGREDAREQIGDLWDAIRAALTPVPTVEPDPFDAEADRVLRVYDELTGAKPGDMFAFDQAPGQRVAVVIATFREPEPRWGEGPLVKHIPETPSPDAGGEVTAPLGCVVVTDGGADPVPVAGTGSADPDGPLLPRRKRSGAL